ncbi:MAG: hypothetical protein AB7I38_04235 [Dehalococcoidia bacterium]
MPARHGHDDHCRELHRALDHAKAMLHSAPIRETLGTDPHAAVLEFRSERETAATEEIARIEQALREHGCTLSKMN